MLLSLFRHITDENVALSVPHITSENVAFCFLMIITGENVASSVFSYNRRDCCFLYFVI